MADKSAQLAACKAAASRYRLQVEDACSKDEALGLAISAAEELMKALKFASDSDEKKRIKQECGQYMKKAEEIKSDPDWRPLNREPTGNETDSIGQSAPNVAISAETVVQSESIAFQAISSRSHNSLNDQSFPGIPGSPQGKANDRHAFSVPSNNVISASTEDSSFTKVTLHGFKTKSSHWSNVNPKSNVRKLAEPVSSRKLSTGEQIIVLKASKVNGFKCPPWPGIPSINEFVLTGGALFSDTHELSLSLHQLKMFQGWTRAGVAASPASELKARGPSAEPSMLHTDRIDLIQDAATDCSVITSLCAGVARSQRGYDEILTNKLYPNDAKSCRPELSPNGKYIVRLNFNGSWRRVVIDDRLPVSSNHRALYVKDRRNPGLLWPALLEKAYLKIRGGYDFLGSNSCSDLWALTGWIPEQAFLQETTVVPDQLWTRIHNAFLYGDVLVTAGTGKMSLKQEREFGLEGQHSYVILDMKQIDQDRLLLIKNPWVEGRGWRGLYPSSVLSEKKSLSSNDGQDGPNVYWEDSIPTEERPHPTTFWMSLEQVVQHFESLYLNWNPGLFRFRQDIHFEWNVGPVPSTACIVEHPQFALRTNGAGPTWLLLSRHFRDVPQETKRHSDIFNDGSIRLDYQTNSSGESPKGYMSIFICDGHGEKIYVKETYLGSSDYVTTPQCMLQHDAEANTTYTVVIDQDGLPPSPYTFSLMAFSNSSMTLEPAKLTHNRQRIEQGTWNRQSAGGDTSSAKYFDNPQYSLELSEHGSLRILLTSRNHNHPMHVKLAIGHGRRLYQLQSRDVLKDSSDYRSGCAYAEVRNLQPGLYTIICSLFEAGQVGDYTLRIDSTSDAIVKAIPRAGAGLLPMKLAPACFGCDVRKIAAPIRPLRLASYTIVVRFLKATSARSADLGRLARSPLRFSLEIGRGPERRFLIASERGEYADSAVIRCESVNMDPSILEQGEVCLVLDRLSGPGECVEEWYEVEIFTDVPQAFNYGVWREWDD